MAGVTMKESLQNKNKALVLEAFDALFNRRDYTAAERFWSPDYIQHSAHIEPGRDGLFNLVKRLPLTFKHERDNRCRWEYVNVLDGFMHVRW